MRSGRKHLVFLSVLCGLGMLSVTAFAAQPGPAGVMDKNFGKGGVASYKPRVKGNYAGWNVAPTKDGGVVQTGLASGGETGFIVKYRENGSPDRDFGSDGLAMLRFKGGNFDPRDLEVGSKNRIVVAGSGKPSQGGEYRGGIASLRPGGRPNPAFGNGGVSLPAELEGFTALELAFAPGGKIVTVGYEGGTPSSNTVVAMFKANGRLDRSFSGDGIVKFQVASNQLDRTVAVDRRGRILVGSPGGSSSNHLHDIARLTPNGSFDRTFGKNGRRLFNPVKRTGEGITDITVDPQGRILVAGVSDGYRGTLVRLRDNGSIDRTFGTKGVTEFTWMIPSKVTFDRKGRVLVIGYSTSGSSDESGEVYRLTQKGKVGSGSRASVKGVAHVGDGFIDAKGRVVASGYRHRDDLKVARLIMR